MNSGRKIGRTRLRKSKEQKDKRNLKRSRKKILQAMHKILHLAESTVVFDQSLSLTEKKFKIDLSRDFNEIVANLS